MASRYAGLVGHSRAIDNSWWWLHGGAKYRSGKIITATNRSCRQMMVTLLTLAIKPLRLEAIYSLSKGITTWLMRSEVCSGCWGGEMPLGALVGMASSAPGNLRAV